MVHIEWNELNPVVNYANILRCAPGFQFGPRIIYDHQFIYISRGKGDAMIGNRHYSAGEGDLFYYGPYIVHHFRANKDQPFELYGLHFTLKGDLSIIGTLVHSSDDLSEALPPANNVLTVGQAADSLQLSNHMRVSGKKIAELFKQMASRFRKNDPASALANRGFAIQLFDALYAQSLEVNSNQSDQLNLLFEIRSRLMEHAHLPYDRQWLADWSGYHEDYLARKFKEQFGLSPHLYHLAQKIDTAKEWLETTGLSATEIADKLHFGSVHYFCRAFKTHTGHAPVQYRRLRHLI